MKKNIFDKKVTGCLFKGVTWGEFVDRIFDFFLPTVNRPISLKRQTDLLFELNSGRFGIGGYNYSYNLDKILSFGPYSYMSIICTDKDRTFETILPDEVASEVIRRVEKYEEARQQLLSKLETLVRKYLKDNTLYIEIPHYCGTNFIQLKENGEIELIETDSGGFETFKAPNQYNISQLKNLIQFFETDNFNLKSY